MSDNIMHMVPVEEREFLTQQLLKQRDELVAALRTIETKCCTETFCRKNDSIHSYDCPAKIAGDVLAKVEKEGRR